MKSMTALSVVLGLYLAPHAAHAAPFSVTCDMTGVQNHDKVIYHFDVPDAGLLVRETSVWRDGSQITPTLAAAYQPTWKFTSNGDTITLWSNADKGWSLSIFNGGSASVFSPTNRVTSRGACTRDGAVAPAPASAVVAPAPNPAFDPTPPPFDSELYDRCKNALHSETALIARCNDYAYPVEYSDTPAPVVARAPAPGPPVADVVPIIVVGDSALITVILGGRSIAMVVDTGATSGAVPTKFADTLIAEGAATELPSEEVRLADGPPIHQRMIAIHDVIVGGHTIHDVKFGVTTGDSMEPLLGFNALSAIGAFRIDAKRGILTFG
jgi:hypothetical protein